MLSLSFLFILDVILLAAFISFGGHVGVDFGIILGSCWGHVGVSERVALEVRKSEPKVCDLGAQVGLQVGPSCDQNRRLTSLEF